MADKMPNPDRLAGLTEEEQRIKKAVDVHVSWLTEQFGGIETSSMGVPVKYIVLLLDNLAASRASDARKKKLLKKHQWDGKTTVKKVFDDTPHACCIECGWEKVGHRGRHTPDCAIAAELEGGEPRKLPEKYGEGESDDSKPEI